MFFPPFPFPCIEFPLSLFEEDRDEEPTRKQCKYFDPSLLLLSVFVSSSSSIHSLFSFYSVTPFALARNLGKEEEGGEEEEERLSD